MDDNAIFDVNFIQIEDIQNIVQEPNDQNIPKVLTINGKVIDEGIGMELAELFPPDVLGAKDQMNIRYWTCRHCLKIENNISAYARHLKEHYKSKQLPKESIQNNDEIECDICSKKFRQQFFLYRHLQGHTGEFTCPMCLTIYSRKKDLVNHQNNCKDGDGIILQCVICKSILQTRKELKHHLIINHSTTNNEIFTRSSENKDGTYSCSFCERNYRRKYRLNNHIKNKHNIYGMNADKECFICNMKFKSTTSALRHRKIHTQGKIYHCTNCDKSFVSEYLLKQHRMKYETSTYSCQYCDSVVRYRHSMTRHIKKCHSDKIQELDKIKIIKGNEPLKKRGPQKKNNRSLTPIPIQSKILNDEPNFGDDLNIDTDIFKEDKMVNLSIFDGFKIDYSLDDLKQFSTDSNIDFNLENNGDQIYVDTDTGELLYL